MAINLEFAKTNTILSFPTARVEDSPGVAVIGKGESFPAAQTQGDIYFYEDPNPVESDRRSRIFIKLHGEWFGLLMPYDFS